MVSVSVLLLRIFWAGFRSTKSASPAREPLPTMTNYKKPTSINHEETAYDKYPPISDHGQPARPFCPVATRLPSLGGPHLQGAIMVGYPRLTDDLCSTIPVWRQSRFTPYFWCFLVSSPAKKWYCAPLVE